MDDVDQLDASADPQVWHVAADGAVIQGRFKIVSFPVDQDRRVCRPIVESWVDVAASGQQQAVDPIEEFLGVDVGRSDSLEMGPHPGYSDLVVGRTDSQSSVPGGVQ